MSLRNQKIEDLWTRKDFIMLKKICIYKRILMLLVLCIVFYSRLPGVTRKKRSIILLECIRIM